MTKKTFAAALVLIAFGFLGAAETARACTAPPPQPPVIHVIFHEICCSWNNPNQCYIRAWIIVRNYQLVRGGALCGCAFNKVGPIVAVDRFEVTEAGTSTPVTGFCFDDSDAVAESASSFFPGNFAGFQAPFPAGASGTVDLHFDVRLQEGSTFDDLKQALESQGAIVTGEVNSTGSFFNPDHLDIVTTFGEITDETANCTETQPVGTEPEPLISIFKSTTVEGDATEACPITLD